MQVKKYLLLAILFAVLPTGVFAYTDTNFSGTMIAEVTPQNPAPGGTVTIKIVSYGSDLNRSNISWSNEGRIFKAGIGERMVSVRIGPSGTKTTINIKAATPEGTILEKEIAFQPAGIDLLWQAHTTVPKYYKGRALPTAGSSITIVAEPNFITLTGTKLGADTLVYEWKRNGNPMEDFSGYGKSSLEIGNLSSISDEKISVVVTDVKGSMVGESSITIPILSPRLAVYEEDPLLGTRFETAIRNIFNMRSQELTLRGEPFFYPMTTGMATPYWTSNGKVTRTDISNLNLITLRQPSNQQGTAALIYGVSTKDTITNQSLQTQIKINFTGEQIKF